MATLSVGREEMYTQPVSAERILAIARRFADVIPLSPSPTFGMGRNEFVPFEVCTCM